MNFPAINQETHSSRRSNEEPESGLSIDQLIRAARRQIWVILLFCVLSVVVGQIYLQNEVPRYTATAVLFIESAKDKSGLSASIADLTFDAGAIDSQLEVLKSEGVALSVLSKKKLDDDPQLLHPQGSWIKRFVDSVRALVNWRSTSSSIEQDLPDDPTERQRVLVGRLESNVEVRRVGRSYIIDVDYTSTDREKAADGANAFAEAYINDQVDAQVDSSRRAIGWLDKRIAELKAKSMDSDLAVQKFKSDNGLLTADGRLVSDQQIAELSTQLIIARGERAKADARYAQIRGLIDSKDVNGVVSETLESPVINELRQKYLSASQLESEISSALGADGPQAVNVRRSMGDYTRMIFDELTRIAAAYRSDAEVARAKEDSLQQSVLTLASQAAEKNQAMVQLREMQRAADSYRGLYTSFLERQQQVQEGQSFPASEARIITPASPPSNPTYPKRTVVMALCLLVGIFSASGVGAFREYVDKTFRAAADVRDGMQLEFLGVLPVVRTKRAKRQAAEEDNSRNVTANNPVLRYAIDNPLTSFAETLRGIKVAVDVYVGQRPTKVVGIISVSPDEGKSTVSKNFASLIAHLGAKVLLIDGDLHRPGLTSALVADASGRAGLFEVIRGQNTLDEALMYEPDSGLFFLPAILEARLSHTSQILASTGMQRLIAEAGQRFDYIVIDLPPIGPVVDVRAMASMFDAFVFVVQWGRTVRGIVETTLLADKEIASRCVGVLYNKVRMDKIKLYEGASAKAFHHREFSKYYSS
jgi:succinoglycan biosynthesis transport protein ExoP